MAILNAGDSRFGEVIQRHSYPQGAEHQQQIEQTDLLHARRHTRVVITDTSTICLIGNERSNHSGYF